ncbi:hypothetical protein [Moorena producens]
MKFYILHSTFYILTDNLQPWPLATLREQPTNLQPTNLQPTNFQVTKL